MSALFVTARDLARTAGDKSPTSGALNGDEELAVKAIAELKGVTVARPKVQGVLFELRHRKKIQKVGLNRYRSVPSQ